MAFNRIAKVLTKGQGFDIAGTTPMINPSKGGQFGYSPDVGNLVSSQAMVRRHVIAKVVETPNFFKTMRNPPTWVENYVEIMERRPISITGLDASLSVATDSVPHGGGGYIQEEFTNVTRQPIDLKYELVDTYGGAIAKFWELYIRYGMMDPETKFALNGTSENPPEDMLLDQYSGTMIFIEPDPTHRKVVRAWLIAGIWPKGNGTVIGGRDITKDLEIVRHSIGFAGVPQLGLGVDHYAQRILDSINLHHADPNLSAAFIKRNNGDKLWDAEVDTTHVPGGPGYVPGLEQDGTDNLYKDKMASGAVASNPLSQGASFQQN